MISILLSYCIVSVIMIFVTYMILIDKIAMLDSDDSEFEGYTLKHFIRTSIYHSKLFIVSIIPIYRYIVLLNLYAMLHDDN